MLSCRISFKVNNSQTVWRRTITFSVNNKIFSKHLLFLHFFTYIQSIDFRVGRGESIGRVCYLSAGSSFSDLHYTILYYLTMFGMNIVKVIHEELILLLVLDFDDVFDLHQEWSVSTEESA